MIERMRAVVLESSRRGNCGKKTEIQNHVGIDVNFNSFINRNLDYN